MTQENVATAMPSVGENDQFRQVTEALTTSGSPAYSFSPEIEEYLLYGSLLLLLSAIMFVFIKLSGKDRLIVINLFMISQFSFFVAAGNNSGFTFLTSISFICLCLSAIYSIRYFFKNKSKLYSDESLPRDAGNISSKKLIVSSFAVFCGVFLWLFVTGTDEDLSMINPEQRIWVKKSCPRALWLFGDREACIKREKSAFRADTDLSSLNRKQLSQVNGSCPRSFSPSDWVSCIEREKEAILGMPDLSGFKPEWQMLINNSCAAMGSASGYQDCAEREIAALSGGFLDTSNLIDEDRERVYAACGSVLEPSKYKDCIKSVLSE